MPRTVLRYAANGASQWGVQFGERIAPLPRRRREHGELLARHWQRICSVAPAQATLPRDSVRLLSR